MFTIFTAKQSIENAMNILEKIIDDLNNFSANQKPKMKGDRIEFNYFNIQSKN